MRRATSAFALAALLAAPVPCVHADERAVRRALEAATVLVETTGCAGVIGENDQLVLTARHCLDGPSLRVRLSTGALRTAWLVAANAASDQAVLFLEEPSGITPLALVRRRQIPGTVLYFEGNPGRPRFQSARLDRIGRCPSLPDLPNALFTSIDGAPGDSGAPLVDAAGRVVGLVHGGVRCHIATPADTLARLVDRVLEREFVGQLTRTEHREYPARCRRGAFVVPAARPEGCDEEETRDCRPDPLVSPRGDSAGCQRGVHQDRRAAERGVAGGDLLLQEVRAPGDQ